MDSTPSADPHNQIPTVACGSDLRWPPRGERKRGMVSIRPDSALCATHFLVMSPAEKGVYFNLLLWFWAEGSIPDNLSILAKFCRVTPAQMRRVWPAISPRLKRVRMPSGQENRLVFRPFEEPSHDSR